ncbi:MAG: hypothetical protein U1F81_20620 [Verrucomicrobiaceae bacterium]
MVCVPCDLLRLSFLSRWAWRRGDLERRRLGEEETWRRGDLEKRRLGEEETGRRGDLEKGGWPPEGGTTEL